MSQPIETKLFINNKHVEAKAGGKITITNPYDQSTVANEVHCAGREDVNDAVAAALAAKGPWRQTSPKHRARLMHNLADLIDKHSDELAELETKSMGAPLWLTKDMATSCAEWFRYYAGWADKIVGEVIPDTGDGVCRMITYEPLGVCGGIAAWNATMLFVGWKIAPALAAGNTFVFKPSEKSPLAVLALGKLIVEAGFPPGVINLIAGVADAGKALAEHMDVAKISFTGSTAAGRKVQVAATNSNLKRCTLEMGGKSASLVFEDADLETALGAMSMAFLVNTTQICAATTRLLVHKSIADDFMASLKPRFEQFASGDPLAAGTFMGPLADQDQHRRVRRFIEQGSREAGVEVVAGGSMPEAQATGGFFATPTIFLNPPTDSSVWREEIFGPVLCVRTFETEEEAIKVANDSMYGLAGSVYTSDVRRGLRVSAALQAGSVGINQPVIPDIRVPFGGFKESGIGREGGKEGLMAYLESKTVSLKLI